MFLLLGAAMTSGTHDSWKERQESLDERLLARIHQRSDGGILKGTRNPEGRTRQADFNTMLSVRYVTTEPFSAGLHADIMSRPEDCTCIWVPVLGVTERIKTGCFSLKYPNGNCIYHHKLVQGRMR